MKIFRYKVSCIFKCLVSIFQKHTPRIHLIITPTHLPINMAPMAIFPFGQTMAKKYISDPTIPKAKAAAYGA